MSQSGYTPIQLYRTTTASAAPTSGNLTAGELAININDADMALARSAYEQLNPHPYRTFTDKIHHQNRGRYLITEVKNGKPGVVDEWTISEPIPVEYLVKK